MHRVNLTPRERAVYPWLQGPQARCHAEIAAMFGVSRSAISHRVAKIGRAFRAAGLTPPIRPGSDLRRVRCGSLSAWAD